MRKGSDMNEEPVVGYDVAIQHLSDMFDAECQARHEMGAEKYGPVKFMTVNSIEEAMAEIVDLANYARYTYIKLALLATSGPVASLIGPTNFSNVVGGPTAQVSPDGFFSTSRRPQ
jgi:hypothetical protein